MRAITSEASLDPEGSVLSSNDRGLHSTQDLASIQRMLRQAIQGDVPPPPSGNSSAFDPEDSAEGSRVCSTVASFDPERVSRSPLHPEPPTPNPVLPGLIWFDFSQPSTVSNPAPYHARPYVFRYTPVQILYRFFWRVRRSTLS